MARLEQHKGRDTHAKQWEHAGQTQLGSGVLSLAGVRISPFLPVPSFQFQAETVWGQRLPKLG